MYQPVFQCGNPAQIVNNVLLADLSYGNILAGAVAQRRAKKLFAQEDAFRVVPERSMPEIGHVRLGFVKPLVDGQVVLGDAP
jgi:hypothetical protein